MKQRKSPLSRARHRGQETGCASALCVLLPLPGVNLPLPHAWRTLNTVTDAVAARGWPWCPVASLVVDRCHVAVESALDASQAERWTQ